MNEPAGTLPGPDRAITFIRDSIIDGTFAADSMLSEADLALQLGMSRTPVRVALARLQDDGWVRIYPKRGALVRGLSPAEIADLADARLVLEVSGVTRATPERRAELAAELAPSIRQQRKALAARDVRGFIELTLDFHGAFLRAGTNRYLIELGGHLSDRQRQMLFAKQHELLQRSKHIIDEHQQLLDCLRDDDVERFAEVLRAHVADTVVHDFGPA